MADRYVLIGRKGEEHSIAILPAAYDTLEVGPAGETYKALGYELLAYADTREPYAPPTPPRASAPKAEKPA